MPQEHWFAIRSIAGEWWDFNSLLPAPRLLSHFYLSAFLSTLKQQGYSIFVICGSLPLQNAGAASAEGQGTWFTPEEVGACPSRFDAAPESALSRGSCWHGHPALRSVHMLNQYNNDGL